MAKYYDIRQHQLSHLSHLREGAQELYNKGHIDSRVPRLEKDLEQARLKWANMAKQHVVWIAEVRKVRKLEADVTELEKSMSQLRSLLLG